jgi:hypothetical protein
MQLNIQELGAGDQNKITYDDILAKMNMQIVGGRLQYIAPSKSQNETNKTNQIYNKYFSKEAIAPVAPAIPVFKTKAEYHQYLLKKRARDRAAAGRSTKLFFYSQPNYSRRDTNTNQLFGLMKNKQ